MTITVHALHSVITKLESNLKNTIIGLTNARAASENLKPEVRAAAELLLKEFEHPQAAAQVLQTVGSVIRASEMKGELEAMLAAMQMTAASDELIDYVEKQIVSNAEVMNSPLPAAGRSGELSAANQSTLDEVAARIAALGQQGSAEGSGAAALQAARGGWNPTKAHGRRKKKA